MADASASSVPEPRYESDFSGRKIKLATIITLANMFATSLLPFGALTLINVPMTTEFGWTQTEFAWAMTSLMWFGACTAPIFGRVADTFGVRLPLMIGTVGVASVTLSLGYITSLWQFYVAFGLLGVFGSSAIGYTKVISALFTQHRGKAMALLGVESTLAGAGIPYLLNWLISDFGWRHMFVICACIIFTIIPIIYMTLDEPGEIGSDRRLFRKRDPDASALILEGLTVPQIMRDRVFWLIVVATIIGTAPRAGMAPSLVPMLLEKGFTQADAVTYMMVSTIIAPFGTLVGGWAMDRVNDSRIAIPFKFISFLGLLVFTLTSASSGGWPMLAIAVGLSGFSFGTARPIGTYLHIRFFGLKAFGFYHGFESAFLAFAMGCAAPLIGYLREASGSYDSAYYVMLASLLGGTILYWLLGPYRYAANIGAVPLPPEDGPKTARSPVTGAIAAATS